MKHVLPWLLAALLAGCATEPRMDGGIGGTGNRPDCEALKRKGATPLPEECKPEPAAR